MWWRFVTEVPYAGWRYKDLHFCTFVFAKYLNFSQTGSKASLNITFPSLAADSKFDLGLEFDMTNLKYVL